MSTYMYGDRAPSNETFVTLSTSTNLDNERVLTGTANQITVTDGGAGSTVTLSIATPLTIDSMIIDSAADDTVALRIQRYSSDGRSQITLEDEDGSQIWRFGLTGPGSTDFSFYDQTQNALVLSQNGDITFDQGGNVVINDLTASRLMASGASKELASTDLNSWVTGTANQIIVTDDGDGTITLSSPQSIDTDADIEVDSITLDDLTASLLVASDASKKLVSVSDLTAWVAGTSNQITVTDDTDGTVTLSAPQDIAVTSNVEFSNLLLDNQTAANVILTVQATASQSAHMQVWEDNNATDMSYIDSTGYGMRIGYTATAGTLSIGGDAPSYTTKGIRVNRDFATSSAVEAISMFATNTGTGDIKGIKGACRSLTSSTVTNLRGIESLAWHGGTGTVTNHAGLYIKSNTNTGGGTVTNNYGIYVEDQTVGSTLNYAFITGLGKVQFGDYCSITQDSTSGAQPVLTLKQDDVSEEFIHFHGSGADGVLTQSIVDAGDEGSSSQEGWIKIKVTDDGNEITDQAYFIPIYTLSA